MTHDKNLEDSNKKPESEDTQEDMSEFKNIREGKTKNTIEFSLGVLIVLASIYFMYINIISETYWWIATVSLGFILIRDSYKTNTSTLADIVKTYIKNKYSR